MRSLEILFHIPYEIRKLLSIPNTTKGLTSWTLILLRRPSVGLEVDGREHTNFRSTTTSSRTEYKESWLLFSKVERPASMSLRQPLTLFMNPVNRVLRDSISSSEGLATKFSNRGSDTTCHKDKFLTKFLWRKHPLWWNLVTPTLSLNQKRLIKILNKGTPNKRSIPNSYRKLQPLYFSATKYKENNSKE